MSDAVGYEETIIGLAVNGADLCPFIESGKLNNSLFDGPDPKTVWTTIEKYYNRKGKLPDVDILVDMFDKSNISRKKSIIAFIKRAAETTKNIGSTEHKIEYYIDRLHEVHVDIHTKQSIQHAIDLLKKGESEKARKYLQTALVDSDKSDSTRTIDLINDLDAIEEDVRRRKEHPDEALTICTGIGPFDKVLTGGLMPGELMLLAAVPSGGKSIGLTDITVSSAELGNRTHLFTIEMGALQTAFRGYGRLSDVSTKKFRNPSLLTEQDFASWRMAVERLQRIDGSGAKITGIPEHASTRTMKAELDRLYRLEGWQPDLILVDYVGIMRPTEPGQFKNASDWAYIGQNVQDLKNWANADGLRMISAVQLHPNAIGKNVLTYNDLGLSKLLISAWADIICAIIPLRPEEMEYFDTIRVQWLKVREGAESDDGQKILFSELAPDFRHIRLHRERV